MSVVEGLGKYIIGYIRFDVLRQALPNNRSDMPQVYHCISLRYSVYMDYDIKCYNSDWCYDNLLYNIRLWQSFVIVIYSKLEINEG